MKKPDQSLVERFFSKVNPVPNKNGCWEWIGSCANYRVGQLHFQNKFYKAHRLSYEIHKGSIPKDKHVCHTCDNPKCCNPEHLWLGTHQENMTDRKLKNRGNIPKGEDNYLSKLKDIDIKKIRDLYKKGRTQASLSHEFNVTQRNIWYIVNNLTWKHVM